jgi:hypothetical protein
MADDRGLCILNKSKIAQTDPASHRIIFKRFLFCILKEIEGGITLLLMLLDMDRNQNCANTSSCNGRRSRTLYFAQIQNCRN